MNIKLIEAGCVALMLAGLFMLGHHFGAKGVQAKWNIEKLAQAEATAEANRENRVIGDRFQSNLAKAQNDHTRAIQRLQSALAVDSATSSRLRDATERVQRSLPDLAIDAVRQRADTLGAIVSECQSNLVEMARHADALNADRQTLIDAWPK